MAHELPDVWHRTFKRNQVEQALWRFFRAPGNPEFDPPPRFRTRTRRLLDYDRKQAGPFAFADTLPGGKGTEAVFSSFDAICLTLGIDLLDMGWNQSDAVSLLAAIRPDLKGPIDELMRGPDRSRGREVPASDYPSLPSFEGRNGPEVDFRVFLVVRRLEVLEVFREADANELADGEPVFLRPEICVGRQKLGDELSKLKLNQHTAVVIEIGSMVAVLCQRLDESRARPRGRSPG